MTGERVYPGLTTGFASEVVNGSGSLSGDAGLPKCGREDSNLHGV